MLYLNHGLASLLATFSAGLSGCPLGRYGVPDPVDRSDALQIREAGYPSGPLRSVRFRTTGS